jgi:hypothetical protein
MNIPRVMRAAATTFGAGVDRWFEPHGEFGVIVAQRAAVVRGGSACFNAS